MPNVHRLEISCKVGIRGRRMGMYELTGKMEKDNDGYKQCDWRPSDTTGTTH
jgi:hypothetical protein